ncbi:MAG: hypothetical protein NTX17_04980 [Candidatus Eisenbacteria bacterium]|nr:hypothetical protein [Candidatus Eisenbacteria bacterium]
MAPAEAAFQEVATTAMLGTLRVQVTLQSRWCMRRMALPVETLPVVATPPMQAVRPPLEGPALQPCQ